MRQLVLLVVALVVATACVPPQGTASPSPGATSSSSPAGSSTPLPTGSRAAALPDMTQTLLANQLPKADIFALTRRMRGRDGSPAKEFVPIRTTPPVEDVGTSRQFWVYDWQAKKSNKITATLRIVTPSAKWWVQDDAGVDVNALRQNANFFDSNIYPTDRRLYGSEWSPGVDADPRVNIMVAKIPGAAAGYYSPTDELPLWVNEFSAERELMYINSLAARAGSTYLNSIVAHEFCHMIEYGRGKPSAVWFIEGHAQLCETENGFGYTHVPSFLLLPDTQLNDWTDLDQSIAHYGEAHLFLEFLRQQAGGDALINAFIDHGIDTLEDLDAVLKARGQKGLDELYADFVAANAFIGTASANPATSYPKGLQTIRNPAKSTDQDRISGSGTLASSVHNYAARYIELPRGPISVKFTAGTRTKLVPTDPHGGATMWWSDHVDNIDSRITRTVDLSKATKLTLSYWTWFEIEKDYDYGYVAVSTDGGEHWTTLQTAATTKDDPNGVNLGNGYTGNSGKGDKPVWIHEDVDLSAYAGKQIQIRFEHIADGALTQHGMAIDDIEIPGIFSDDAEGDSGWTAEGFMRSTNFVSQRYVVQVLRFTDAGATVERRFVTDGTLQLDVDTSNDRRAPMLAVTGLAVRTTQALPFEVAVDRR